MDKKVMTVRLPTDAHKILCGISEKTFESFNSIIVRLILQAKEESFCCPKSTKNVTDK
jgi:hypothetical protein